MKPIRSIAFLYLLSPILLLSACNDEPKKPEFDIMPYVFTAIFSGLAGAVIMAACADSEAKQQSTVESAKKAKREKRFTDALDKIPTSSDEILVGYRTLRHVKFISTSSTEEQDIAEIDFLIQVKAAGANGVIRMKIVRQGAALLIEGDAVSVEPTTSPA